MTVDAQAAATEALAICAECRKLDEAALSGDPKWMGDGDDIWARTNRLLALIEPVAEGYVALAARLEAAETERDEAIAAAHERIRQHWLTCGIIETEKRDTYGDGYLSGLVAALGLVLAAGRGERE